MKSIINGKIWHRGDFISGHVLLYGETIEELLEEDAYSNYLLKGHGVEEIDAKGAYVLPGFIDVHIHGYRGKDVMDGNLESLGQIAKEVCENGVTTFLATTMTMDKQSIIKALDNIRHLSTEGTEGAMVFGAHLEGPFINVAKKGAQPGEHVCLPDPELVEAYKDILKVVTIAPEVAGALEMIETYGDTINFSLGHTAATFDQAKEAYEKGAKGTTHLFNAMTPLNHREPGVVGAALGCDCHCELIADDIHINPGLYPFIAKTKGLEKLLLITDCMRAGGLGEGHYTLGGQAVTVKNGRCTLDDGTIAGSVLKLMDGLRNFHRGSKEELKDLIPLVTLNQAQYLGVDEIMGTLDIGKLANITIMDEAFNIHSTIVKGNKHYENHL